MQAENRNGEQDRQAKQSGYGLAETAHEVWLRYPAARRVPGCAIAAS